MAELPPKGGNWQLLALCSETGASWVKDWRRGGCGGGCPQRLLAIHLGSVRGALVAAAAAAATAITTNSTPSCAAGC